VEKKNLDETVKVIEVKKPNHPTDINQVILPKSPYLQKMHCAFRDLAKQNAAK
jgi:hypothetical protein